MADVLIVTSKVKKYVKENSGCNTAGDVAAVLTTAVQRLCDAATDKAKADGRKTVMARDFVIETPAAAPTPASTPAPRSRHPRVSVRFGCQS